MRGRRIKISNGIYHLMSRTVDGEFFFGEGEKEMIRRMLRAVAEFSGVEVLTYCLMDNHFHLLVRVPEGRDVDDEELVRRYRVLYGSSRVGRSGRRVLLYSPDTPEQVAQCLRNGGFAAERMRERLRGRMYDVSEFMKTLKQRISIWYNSTRDRQGPLWMDRFKSVLVEGRKEVLLVMAAYIDLNPVRAGLVEDPKAYRFCGYAEALAGDAQLQSGLRQVTGIQPAQGDWKTVLVEYRKLLLSAGSGSKAGKARLKPAEVRDLLENGRGDFTRGELLGYRLKYLLQGMLLGSEEWVREQLRDAKKILGRKLPPKPRFLSALGLATGRRVRA